MLQELFKVVFEGAVEEGQIGLQLLSKGLRMIAWKYMCDCSIFVHFDDPLDTML